MNPHERFAKKRKWIIWIGILTLLLNYSMFWIFSHPIPYEKNIFYWPLALKLFWNLYCPSTLAAVLFIILLVAYSVKHISKWKKIATISFSLLLGLFIVYISFWIPWVNNNVYHYDSVKFQEKIYHVTITRKFDRGGEVLLGECEASRYFCEFHPIIEIGYIDYNEKNLELRANNEMITIFDKSISNPGGKLVYRFDRYSEECYPTTGLFCPSR